MPFNFMDRLFDSGAKLTHFLIESIGSEMIKTIGSVLTILQYPLN